LAAPERSDGIGQAVRAVLLAVALAAFVIMFVPSPQREEQPPPPTVSTVGCAPTDDLCRAVELLEDLRDDPTLTEAEREALAAVAEGLAEEPGVGVETTTSTAPPTTRPAPSTTSTTTTTTIPRVPRDPETVANEINDDLGVTTTTATTIVEGDGGDE
jgi:hypothetical protein